MDALRLALLLASIVLCACGTDEPACGGPLRCEELASEPDWAPGSMEAVPDDFPPAPTGSQLCGQSAGPIVHYLTDDPGTVHQYYRDALTAMGWTATGPIYPTEPTDAGLSCATEQDFTTGDPLVLVRVYSSRDAFTLSLRNLDN